MGWANGYKGHKTTLVCPIDGCKYHSRRFLITSENKNNSSNSSTKCPIHQKDLVSIGAAKNAVLKLSKK